MSVSSPHEEQEIERKWIVKITNIMWKNNTYMVRGEILEYARCSFNTDIQEMIKNRQSQSIQTVMGDNTQKLANSQKSV